MKSLMTVFSIFFIALLAFANFAKAEPAQMNDLSILLPLATNQADFDSYLKASDQGLGGALIPSKLYAEFNTPFITAIGPKTQLVYETLKAVSIRIDPCFGQIGPILDSTGCQNQLRIIFQSLTFSNGNSSAEDSGVHAFYSLTREQLKAVIQDIILLRNQNNGVGDLGPLAVHPIILKQGLSGPMAIGLKAILKKYAGPNNLVRLTRLNGNSDTWIFNGSDIVNGALVPMIIPTLPDNAITDNFIAPVPTVKLNGSFSPLSLSKDNIQDLARFNDAINMPVSQQQEAFDAALRIENPDFHSANTINCASCHVAQAAIQLNGSALNFWPTSNKNTFIAPASVPAQSLVNTTLSNITTKNFHAFSYRDSNPIISQRVINETAVVLDTVNAQILK